MKTRYDTKAIGHQFKEGDKVWFYNPTRRKGLSPKLQSHWDGPLYNFKDNKRRRNPDPFLGAFRTTGRSSAFRLGKADLAFHPFSGSINEY
ncbi:hypothetical protein TNCV_1645871 [Trichonephila clavipes]|nr:hypothetical protein TNCV_1645871 [Trichonephila clavipes]